MSGSGRNACSAPHSYAGSVDCTACRGGEGTRTCGRVGGRWLRRRRQSQHTQSALERPPVPTGRHPSCLHGAVDDAAHHAAQRVKGDAAETCMGTAGMMGAGDAHAAAPHATVWRGAACTVRSAAARCLQVPPCARHSFCPPPPPAATGTGKSMQGLQGHRRARTAHPKWRSACVGSTAAA